MTDEQISRLLAEHLGMIEGPYDVPASGRNVEPGSVMREIKIPNFLTDPAMRDLLQAKLLEEGWNILELHSCPNGIFIKILKGFDQHWFVDTRERIWALAYLKSKGLNQ